MDNIALLNLEGMSMAGHPGVAAKLFGALERVGISVILISQVRKFTVGVAVPAKHSMMRLYDLLVTKYIALFFR